MGRRARVAVPPDEGLLPGVLTVGAVKAGYMPRLGESGLPVSLEKDVPPQYRYWEADDAAEARGARDALVESATFTAKSLYEVNGEVRRVVHVPHLVVVEEDEGIELAKRLPAGEYAAQKLGVGEVLVMELGDAPGTDVAELEKVAGGKSWLAVFEDGDDVRAGLVAAKSLFTLETREGLLFASSVGFGAPEGVRLISAQKAGGEKVAAAAKETVGETDTVKKDARGLRFLKAEDAEERYVLGVVLEPEVEDAQGDIYSAEEIRKAAHGFMENYQGRMVVQHARDEAGEPVAEPSIVVLENYLAPVAFSVGEEKVKKGTWLLAARFQGDELWKAAKAGELTGWSIAGWATSTSEVAEVEE